MDSQLLKDFEKTNKIILSCETIDQLNTAKNLYNVFKLKWAKIVDLRRDRIGMHDLIFTSGYLFSTLHIKHSQLAVNKLTLI